MNLMQNTNSDQLTTLFPFLFFLSVGWYCGAGVFGLIGCISLSLSLALQTFFNNNNNIISKTHTALATEISGQFKYSPKLESTHYRTPIMNWRNVKYFFPHECHHFIYCTPEFKGRTVDHIHKYIENKVTTKALTTHACCIII